jgi:WD40 repeat protein
MTRDQVGIATRRSPFVPSTYRGPLPGKLWLCLPILALGAFLGYRRSAPDQQRQEKGNSAPAPAEVRKPGVRPVADPLPAGVRVRLGLLRLRHGGFVNTAAFSPDGKMLASGGRDSLVRLWEVPTGKELRRFEGHPWPVSSVLFSTDGKTLVSADLIGSIRFWDVRTGHERHRINQPGREFSRLQLSPDGRTLAAASCHPTGTEGTVHLWALDTGKEIRQIKLYKRSRVAALAFSPDGKLLASAPMEQELNLWDLATGKQVRRIEVKGALISEVAFCSDGKSLLGLSGLTGTLLSWDLATGKVRHRVESGVAQAGASLLSFALLPGGRTLLVLRLGGGLTTFDAVTLKELRRFGSAEDSGRKLILSRDGKRLAFLDGDNSITLAQADSGKAIGPRGGHWTAVRSLAWSADGKLVVTAGDNTPVVWDAASGKELHRLRGHRGMVNRVAFLPDGKTLVSGSQDRSVCFWETATGKELRRYQALEQLHAVSPDGKLLAALTSGTGESSLVVRDTAAGKELRRLPFPPEQGSLSALVFSPDGRTLVAGRAYARKIKRWDVASGKELPPFDFPPRPRSFDVSGVRSLAFSPDGKVLASVHHNGTVRLWDAQTGATLRDLSYRSRHTGELAFSPNGKMLAVAVEEQVVLVELITGKERGRRRGHQGWVTSLAFSPDGRFLLTGGADTTALVWDLARAAH